MENVFITDIIIDKVRHLENIRIHLSDQKKKHLIITGKNGSGKTSLLDAMAVFMNSVTSSCEPGDAMQIFKLDDTISQYVANKDGLESEWNQQFVNRILSYMNRLVDNTGGVMLKMNCPLEDIRPMFDKGQFVTAYYQADRVFNAAVPVHVEKVELKKNYKIRETPREDFIKYLLDLKVTQALAVSSGKREKAESIQNWFDQLQDLLRRIFQDDSVILDFDEDTFRFQIRMDGREPFNFNTLSSGYAAVLDIVVDLILRMENQTNRSFDFSVQGVVLIDEIETHLHLELQKRILDLLTTIFPNIQFIVSTHSPFILNSLEDAAIYDLEKNIFVEHGLSDIPYGGIVEGYFNADSMSAVLREKYEAYKKIVDKPKLTDDDFAEIADLEMYLDEIPDYLALNITTEYQRLKARLRKREDI